MTTPYPPTRTATALSPEAAISKIAKMCWGQATLPKDEIRFFEISAISGHDALTRAWWAGAVAGIADPSDLAGALQVASETALYYANAYSQETEEGRAAATAWQEKAARWQALAAAIDGR